MFGRSFSLFFPFFILIIIIFFTNLRSVSPVYTSIYILRALNTLDALSTLYTLVTEEKGWCDADFFRISLVVGGVELVLERG